jgi:very-short-patch-repair endonuclease
VVAAWQLLRLGFTRRQIECRLASGRLHAIHRGVYAVGHRVLDSRGVQMAAVLACGRSAVLSHRAAARLWAIRPDSRRAIDVTVPGPGRRPRDRISVHAVRALDPRDRAVIEGIPVTTLARTLLDLAEVVPEDHVARAIEEAARRRIFDLRALEELLARSPGRRGRRRLRGALEDHIIEPATRSELERRFFALCREAGLPRPMVNTLVEGYEVDFYWPDIRLVAELDSFESHGTRRAFERDRERDATLMLAGHRVVRITWRQVTRSPAKLVARLRALRDYTP